MVFMEEGYFTADKAEVVQVRNMVLCFLYSSLRLLLSLLIEQYECYC